MTLVVALHDFYSKGYSNNSFTFQKNVLGTSVEMGRITLVVHWNNCIHRFTLITLLLQEKCPLELFGDL